VLQVPRIDAAAGYDDAMRRIAALQALDGPEILAQARTTLLTTGSRTRLAVVLLHGFTNHPGQYREFAPLLLARGVNVLVPRLPEHGDRNRLTDRLSRLTAQAMLDTASRALDAAHGLGERVCIAGISSSGLLCAYFAQFRRDLERSIPISPAFALLDFARPISAIAVSLLRILPDRYLWWDPRVKNGMHPLTAYPRFSTRALAQTMLAGDDVWNASKAQAFSAVSVTMLMNRADPAVNNGVSAQLLERWQQHRAGASSFTFDDLPRNHDIIEPDNPNARTGRVYPVLLQCILGERPA
jgi:alpha-beta hydrolase superfamily lysophospholipase